jgi:hypothetical protein
VRGIGGPKRAGLFDVESLSQVVEQLGSVGPGGPAQPGRMAATGLWWLLRKISAVKAAGVGTGASAMLVSLHSACVRHILSIDSLNLGGRKEQD